MLNADGKKKRTIFHPVLGVGDDRLSSPFSLSTSSSLASGKEKKKKRGANT